MKILRYFIAAILFLVCLEIGYSTSRYIQASSAQLDEPSPGTDGPQIDISLSEQVNVVLITVNDLTVPVPELTNVWWIAYSPHNPLTILRIYPSVDGKKDDNRLIEKAFMIDQDKTGRRFLGEGMRNQLAKQEIPWNYYIIIDQTSLEAFLKITGLTFDISSDVDWETFCWKIYAQSGKIELSALKDYYSRHTISDKSPEEMIRFWQAVLNRKDNRLCDFPQLQNSSVVTP